MENYISIIIPVYNSENKISRCLESLKAQTCHSFEVIFVDDQSSDNTLRVLCHFKNEVSSLFAVSVFRNKLNLGPGPTRNFGVKQAKGNYILFLDSDDYLAHNTIGLLIDTIARVKAEAIIFDVYFERCGGNRQYMINNIVYKDEPSCYISIENAIKHTGAAIHGKAFLRDMLIEHNIEFANLMRNEDLVFTKVAFAFCNKIYYLRNALYYYVQCDHSIMHDDKLISVESSIVAYREIEKRLAGRFDYELKVLYVREVIYSNIIKRFYLGATIDEIKKELNVINIKALLEPIKKDAVFFSRFQRTYLFLAKYSFVSLLSLLAKVKKFINSR
ncbi:MAG: glycosyltransferase family 2 protein [Cloacibacillus sp.]